MTTKKLPKSNPPKSRESLSTDADFWNRQFIKHFEFNILEACRDLSPDATVFESQMAVARAVLTTYLDSGIEFESAVELFGQAVIEKQSVAASWNDELNRRRFDLIDKDIQGTLSPSEKIELAGLTRIMRQHVEAETNLPMKGARILRQKLLQLDGKT